MTSPSASIPTERQTQRGVMRSRPIPRLSSEDLARFWSKAAVKSYDECWLWQAPSPGRYGMFSINGNNYLPSRVSWALHFGPIPLHKCVCHRCDVPKCVNPRHLFLGTHTDNMADKMAKGRHHSTPLRGERQNGARLKNADIAAIRADPRRQREIAADYGVNQSTISDIKRGETWAHL